MGRWLPDVLALVGAGLFLLGLWLMYPPAALCAAGVGLVGVAVRGAKTWES
jgi:hypothetical protein